MTGAERLRQTLQRLRGKRPTRQPPGTPEWAEDIETRVQVVERQIRLLNSTLLIALLADIATRLLKP